MPITLHADLLDTDLTDFDYHWWRGLLIPNTILTGAPDRTVWAKSSREDPAMLDIANAMLGGKPEISPAPTMFAFYNDDYKAAQHGPPGMPVELAATTGYVVTVRSVFAAVIQYHTGLLSTRDCATNAVTVHQPPSIYFALYAARYRRSQIKLVVDESDKGGRGAAYLLAWLRSRWGEDGVVELPTEDAPLPVDGDGLTPRQHEIADLIADGRTDAEIAQELFISPNTAKTHRGDIAQRLGIQDLKPGGLARELLQRGYGKGGRQG